MASAWAAMKPEMKIGIIVGIIVVVILLFIGFKSQWKFKCYQALPASGQSWDKK